MMLFNPENPVILAIYRQGGNERAIPGCPPCRHQTIRTMINMMLFNPENPVILAIYRQDH